MTNEDDESLEKEVAMLQPEEKMVKKRIRPQSSNPAGIRQRNIPLEDIQNQG